MFIATSSCQAAKVEREAQISVAKAAEKRLASQVKVLEWKVGEEFCLSC